MDIQEISDRLEINNLLIDYCSAVDAKNFAEFDRIFTADALIDYTALGGIREQRQASALLFRRVVCVRYGARRTPRLPRRHLGARCRVRRVAPGR